MAYSRSTVAVSANTTYRQGGTQQDVGVDMKYSIDSIEITLDNAVIISEEGYFAIYLDRGLMHELEYLPRVWLETQQARAWELM